MSSEALSPSHEVKAEMLANERGHAYRPAVPPANSIDQQTPQARRRELIIRSATWLTHTADKYFARQSLVPNSPVLDANLFPWTQELERNWKAVRSELMIVLQNYELLPRFQDISPDQGRISADDKWRTFFFWGFGRRAEQNCQFCPQTSALLEQVPGLQTAFFSILAPGKVVPPHTGITKGLIRAHLAIVVPVSPAECFMDVGDVRCTWQEGQILVFDDTYTHAVSNSADQMRVVLLFDFSRPLKWPGRLLRWVLFGVMRRTPYVQDALRNEARWSRTYYS